MIKIATLGPKNTFTDLAAHKYLSLNSQEMKPTYYSSIIKTFNAIGSDCEYGILPIENSIDGYVQVTLDLLAKGDLKIIHEVVLPIDFMFISKKRNPAEIKTLYVQFKSHNQCLNFIEGLGNIDIVTTPSNGTSYNEFLNNDACDAVIIPSHILDDRADYQQKIEHVADTLENETRFVILSTKLNENEIAKTQWRSSFVVQNDKDRPGLLSDILNIFAEKNINLKSIISRPRKNGLGNYNFFIDVEGCWQRDSIVKIAVETIMKDYNIKILGSYYTVEKR